MLLRFAKIARVFAILGVIGMVPSFTLAQTTDRLVGSWNFQGYSHRRLHDLLFSICI